MPAIITKPKILATAYALAQEVGVHGIRRNEVAKRAEVAEGLVSFYFEITALKAAVVKEAIRLEDVEVLRGVVFNPIPGAPEIPAGLRSKILK
jgi:AcrR family transcriptional regulator